MYLLELYHHQAFQLKAGTIQIDRELDTLAKWTFLPANLGQQRLQCIALACAGLPFVRKLFAEMGPESLIGQGDALRLEARMALHFPNDGNPSKTKGVLRGLGLKINRAGEIQTFYPRKFSHLSKAGPGFKIPGRRAGPHFFTAYGAVPRAEAETRFEFADPWHLMTRFRGLFQPEARLANPIMTLDWLRLKAVRYNRFPKLQTMLALQDSLPAFLGVDTRQWRNPDHDYQADWETLGAWQRAVLLVLLDLVRHVLEAFPHTGHPLHEPLLVLLHRPDRYCPPEHLSSWLELLHALFPAAQCIVTLPQAMQPSRKHPLRTARLPFRTEPASPLFPVEKPLPANTSRRQPPGDKVALVEVDGRLPNFALMKISGYYKSQGRRVDLYRRTLDDRSYAEVWASSIFFLKGSQNHVRRLRSIHGDRLRLGGSGVDIQQRLPPEMEAAEPDFELYPSLEDRAMGFLTRGCTNKCAFCIVPRKEGTIRQVAELDEVLRGRTKLILLDDNILAHNSGPDLLAQMVDRRIEVNFNQTLDLRLVDTDTARLLRRVRAMNVRFSRPCLHFSLNNAENLETLRRHYDLLGFTARDNVEFICMYGYNTTLEEDVRRFRFLRTLPGAYVFCQRYRAFPGSPEPELANFFGPDPDPLLDELVRIIFPQNMKSMEIYYRWISRRYAEIYGRLHKNLVDTIFRYNQRDQKGLYIATLAGTRSVPEFDG